MSVSALHVGPWRDIFDSCKRGWFKKPNCLEGIVPARATLAKLQELHYSCVKNGTRSKMSTILPRNAIKLAEFADENTLGRDCAALLLLELLTSPWARMS
jgi:hypothetical protein